MNNNYLDKPISGFAGLVHSLVLRVEHGLLNHTEDDDHS